jgi:hypothetical protein
VRHIKVSYLSARPLVHQFSERQILTLTVEFTVASHTASYRVQTTVPGAAVRGTSLGVRPPLSSAPSLVPLCTHAGPQSHCDRRPNRTRIASQHTRYERTVTQIGAHASVYTRRATLRCHGCPAPRAPNDRRPGAASFQEPASSHDRTTRQNGTSLPCLSVRCNLGVAVHVVRVAGRHAASQLLRQRQ